MRVTPSSSDRPAAAAVCVWSSNSYAAQPGATLSLSVRPVQTQIPTTGIQQYALSTCMGCMVTAQPGVTLSLDTGECLPYAGPGGKDSQQHELD
jgi:hypothetical protein